MLYASPYHMSLLAKDASALGLADLRLAISTAEGLRANTARAFAARFGKPVAQALGIIEVGLPVLNLRAAARQAGRARPAAPRLRRVAARRGRPAGRRADARPTRPARSASAAPGCFDAYLDPWTPARDDLEPDGFRTGDQG